MARNERSGNERFVLSNEKPTGDSSPVGYLNTQLLLAAGIMPAETEMNPRQTDVAAVIMARHVTVAGLIAAVSVATMTVAGLVGAMAVIRIRRCVTVTIAVAGLIAVRVVAGMAGLMAAMNVVVLAR